MAGPFAHLLGIRPWDLDRLTATHFDACADYIRALHEGGGGGRG